VVGLPLDLLDRAEKLHSRQDTFHQPSTYKSQAGEGKDVRYSKLPEGFVGEEFWQGREEDLQEIGPTVWAIIVPQVHVATFQVVVTGGGRVAAVTAVDLSMWTML